MNELRIFSENEFEEIKDFQKERPNAVMGIVYAVEYDKGYCKIGMSSIPADRAEIKDEHLILYKKDSIVYFCPIERIDNFHARKA